MFCLGAWGLYDALRLGQVQLVVALIAVVAGVMWVGSAVPYWNRLLAYVRGEHTKMTPAGPESGV